MGFRTTGLAIAGFLLPALLLAEEPLFVVSDLKMERNRYGQGDLTSQTVTTGMSLLNIAGRGLGGVRARLRFYTAEGEKIRETAWDQERDFAAGQRRSVAFREGRLPAFSSWDIVLEARDGGVQVRQVYFSNSAHGLPEFQPAEPAEGIADLRILGQSLDLPAGTERHPALFVRLRNFGKEDATGIKVSVSFHDKAGKVLARALLDLGAEKVRSGETRGFRQKVKVDRLPPWESYRVSLAGGPEAKSVEEQLGGGEFSGEAVLEMARFRFARDKGGALTVQAEVRNGTADKVASLKAHVLLTDDGDRVVEDVVLPVEDLGAGEIRPVRTVLKAAKPFKGMRSGIELPPARTDKAPAISFRPVESQVRPGTVGVARVTAEPADGIVAFAAVVVNRNERDLKALDVVFELLGTDGQVVASGREGLADLKAGESREVASKLEAPAAYGGFRCRVELGEAR